MSETVQDCSNNVSEPRKKLPDSLTSYDLFKTLAVFLMILGSFGSHFLPDIYWFRALGLLSLPIWFFLIGYARTRDIPVRWIQAIAVVMLASIVTGGGVFPVSVLLTMILIRLVIDNLIQYTDTGSEHLWMLSIFSAVLILPTSFVTAYGTQGLILAMLGFMVRHEADLQAENSDEPKRPVSHFAGFSVLSFLFMQEFLGLYPPVAFVFLALGAGLIHLALLKFEPRVYDDLTQKLPVWAVQAMQYCGRNSLEIYVVHLVVFKFLAAILGTAGYAFFTWRLLGV